jgi:hypothetical protein
MPFKMGFTNKVIRIVGTVGFILTSFAALAFGSEPVSPATITIEKSSNVGIIKGIVRDEGGSPIAEASVAIFRNGTSKLLKQVTSNRDGSFLARIIPGTYSVLAVAQGFNPVTLFGVEVSRASQLTYGFKLERAGGGNTLPEKRVDRNSSKWRIRAAQMQRAIYQNREGKEPTVATVETAGEPDEKATRRPGQSVVETYFTGSDRGNFTGVNFATLIQSSDDLDFVIAGQVGTGRLAPQRLELSTVFRPNDDHQLRFTASAGKLGQVAVGNTEKALGQISFQALDEWKIREGIIVVYGVDYSRFVGAGEDSSISPRLGFQFDLNSKTRFRSAFAAQTQEKSWANAIDLEGQSVAFTEPVAIDDLFVVSGKPQMNKSRRVEFGIERIIDNRSSVEANIFLDTTSTRGVGINAIGFDTLGDDGFGDIVANQQGRAAGIRVVYTRRLNGILTTSAGYSYGNGQRLSSLAITDPDGVFENDFFQSFFAQLAADLKTGTSVRTIYRLSSQATVFAIDPFKGRLAIYDPGLSVYVTQHIPTLGLPIRATAVVDARNIFDLQSGIFGEEGGLRLNSHRRMLRGGIQVRF